ncbi:MAG: hypothetical protein IT276_04330 [Ignavibacteriaceae bacterium]|nr:hypothetical protein [Ignavibacteriaceae bacterium]
MNITAVITGIKYQVICADDLPELSLTNLDINSAPSRFLLSDKKHNYGISKWVSPKRTRSYPFERVYNSLNVPKRITIIPIIKDEGLKGDRDFIQWDTISLMSLLDVYVILAYYNKATIHPSRENKVTSQEFDNDYVKNKIVEISNYHSSALHWNLKEIKETLPSLITIVQESYNRIQKELNITFHNSKGIETFKKQFLNGVKDFMDTSRNKAKYAQNREMQTIQPKEFLLTSTKATITIKNYLGGMYYFTTDEIEVIDKSLYLIESKHSIKSKLPSIGDIKDGLLKMVLYCNLVNVKVNNLDFTPKPILKLTSTNISGKIRSASTNSAISSFKNINKFNDNQINIIDRLFDEAQTNHFEVLIEGV